MAALRQPPPLPRAPDWAASAAVAAALREEGRYALLLATEPMAQASSGWRPPTPRQLAAWACERAQQLDATAGARLAGWAGWIRWMAAVVRNPCSGGGCSAGAAADSDGERSLPARLPVLA